jgi:hypothetical protein
VKVSGVVRASVSVDPDEIIFVNVPHGKSHEQQLHVGAELDPFWRVKNVQCSSEDLQVKLPEPLTSTQQIVYKLPVRLSKDTPVGALSEQLLLVTNRVGTTPIPVHVSGRVTPDLWTSDYLFFGEVVAGEQISKKVVVHGTKPCQITSVKSNGEPLQFKSDDVWSTRHIVEITFQAKQVGHSKELISITSDIGQIATATAFITVVPASRR